MKEWTKLAIIKCEKGHFYDNVKYEQCPHCAAKKDNAVDEDSITVAKIAGEKLKKNLVSLAAGEDEKTVGIFSHKKELAPVAGWLVCVDGPEKGRDWRIANGRNFIGRSYKSDIAVSADEQVSRENHCSIVYDPKSEVYSLVPGENALYYKDAEVMAPIELEAYDTIKIGATTLQFVPYLRKGVQW